MTHSSDCLEYKDTNSVVQVPIASGNTFVPPSHYSPIPTQPLPPPQSHQVQSQVHNTTQVTPHQMSIFEYEAICYF